MNATLRPVEAAPPTLRHALPAWVYNHPEMSRLEYERLFRPSWQLVCHVSALENPGDYSAIEIGRESILVVKSTQGQIQAFHNVCRHRGARILNGQGNCPGAITCPYHGWSYKLTGELLGMPNRETFPSLERASLGLKPVRMEVFSGFVFVCLDGELPALADFWGDIAGEFVAHHFERMRPLAPMYVEHWACDWKVAMDNYLESYHVPVGHPGLFRMLTPDFDDQSCTDRGVARGASWLRERPSPKWTERMYQKMVGAVSGHLPEADRRRWSFYSMLPNLGIDVFPDQMDFFQVLPRGPGQCTIRGQVFGLPDTRREMRIVRYLNARINRQVQREDEFLCTRVQEGLASPSYEPGPLSSIEGWMLQFHDLLRARIPEARLPSAPARFA
ncbi:MAG: aromatic ring-hydroxylating dioxygenase subunit alpha [Proteobacteria bacterium]|nr:aromatic ring-hydroxylating dioxygenase subunit alpha [Pseudomonadota bacterium]